MGLYQTVILNFDVEQLAKLHLHSWKELLSTVNCSVVGRGVGKVVDQCLGVGVPLKV